MLRFRRAVLVASVLFVASAIAGVAQPRLGRSADAQARTITVSGHGAETTVPDRASFSFTVESRAQTATGAVARTSDVVAAVVKAVEDAGVASADVRTSELSLAPQTTQDGTSIVGYIASSTISVDTSIARAGPVVDAAVRAGADGVSGPGLSRSDDDALYRDALRRAVADANDNASAIAAAAGLTLGPVQSIVEGGSQLPVPLAAKADFGTAIEPGTQTVEATVTVTYAVS